MRPFPSSSRSALRLPVGLVPFVAAAIVPAVALAQGGVIRGTVSDSVGGMLGYSVVSILPEDRRILTDDAGRFVLTGMAAGSYRLRARHLGYLPLDTVITVGAGELPPLELRLTHVAIRLAEMRVVGRGPCLRPGPPDPDTNLSLAIIFGQLRDNADRAIALQAQFPFVYRMQRRVSQQSSDGSVRPAGTDTVAIDGGVSWIYRRGEVITIVNDHGKPTRQLNIPGLVQLADSGFHNSHCFTYGGVEKIGRKPYIRVDFAPDRLIDTPDIEGSVYLDPESYQISRLVMSLTHTEKLDSKIEELKVTSSFREIVASIAILDSAEGVTTFEMPERGRAPVRTERQKMVNVVFTRTVPPGAVLH